MRPRLTLRGVVPEIWEPTESDSPDRVPRHRVGGPRHTFPETMHKIVYTFGREVGAGGRGAGR